MSNDNKADSINDLAPQAMNNPIQGEPPSVPELSRHATSNSLIQPREEYFEVVEKKQPIIGDTDDFMKILNQLKQAERNTQRRGDENARLNLKKKESKLKVMESSKSIKPEETKKDRILETIKPHVSHFKAYNTPNSSDTEVTRLRLECREKIFKFLLYGIEQLKQTKPEQLTAVQAQLAKLRGKQTYAAANKLLIEIDVDILNALNSGNKQSASKKYKNFLKSLANNISDESNTELRRKILRKEYSSKKIVQMDEEQFYPPHVKQKLLEKQNALLREAAASEKPMTAAKDEIDLATHINEHYSFERTREEEKKQKYKHLEESSLLMLKDLLKAEQVQKMKNLLQFEGRADIEGRLNGNIQKVFQNLI